MSQWNLPISLLAFIRMISLSTFSLLPLCADNRPGNLQQGNQKNVFSSAAHNYEQGAQTGHEGGVWQSSCTGVPQCRWSAGAGETASTTPTHYDLR
jgi:hypothetical protein